MRRHRLGISDEPRGRRSHVIAVKGDFDLATHERFKERFERVVAAGHTHVVVDLTEATFVDSVGLAALLRAARRLRRPNCSLAVVASRHDQPRQRLQITGTGAVLHVCATLEEALRIADEDAPAARPAPKPASRPPVFRLRLFIDSGSPLARHALDAVAALKRDHLRERVETEVVDVRDDPGAAEREGLLATPALIRQDPPPRRHVVGDLSDHEQVLYALGLHEER